MFENRDIASPRFRSAGEGIHLPIIGLHETNNAVRSTDLFVPQGIKVLYKGIKLRGNVQAVFSPILEQFGTFRGTCVVNMDLCCFSRFVLRDNIKRFIVSTF